MYNWFQQVLKKERRRNIKQIVRPKGAFDVMHNMWKHFVIAFAEHLYFGSDEKKKMQQK